MRIAEILACVRARVTARFDRYFHRPHPASPSHTMADAAAKYDLITRRLDEVLGGDSIKAILAEGRTPKCYWGKSLKYVSWTLVLIAMTACRNCTDWTTYVNEPRPAVCVQVLTDALQPTSDTSCR